MSTADTYVRARIDTNTKERATKALEAMGLSISDAIRLLMLRVADERRLPFEIKVPSTDTDPKNKAILPVDRSNQPVVATSSGTADDSSAATSQVARSTL